MVEHLPSSHTKPWDQSAAPYEKGVMVQACNLSTWEGERGGSENQGQPWLQSKLEASLGYVNPCLRTSKAKPNQATLKCISTHTSSPSTRESEAGTVSSRPA